MRKLLLLLPAAFACLSANAQTPPASESIVVSRYADDESTEFPQTEPVKAQSYKKVWFGLDVGFTTRIASVADGVDDETRRFINKMRSGITYGFDIHGSVSRASGVGVRFSGHHYGFSEGGLSDRVNTFYIAPSYQLRLPNRRDTGDWVLGISIGYVSFTEKVNGNKITKGGYGDTLHAGYYFRLGKKKNYLGIKLTLTGGIISFAPRMRESLNAIDIGIGYRF